MSLRVLIPDPKIDDPALFQDPAGVLAFDLVPVNAVAELPDGTLETCDAFCMFTVMPMDRAVIERMGRCRLIVRAGVGFDNVDLKAAADHGIPVANVPDYGINEVADHALALLLHFTRSIGRSSRLLRADPASGWGFRHAIFNRRTFGRRAGIVGLGRIGSAMARRLQGLGMHVVAYDPYLPSGMELALDATRVGSLGELLAAADIVSLHVPLTDETRNMIDAGAVAAMRPGTILINTSRGPVVDFDAVHDGMKHGPIQCAGLDVMPVEPLDRDNRLVKAWLDHEAWIEDRLVLTPHVAFYSPDSIDDMRTKAIDLIGDYLAGRPLRNWVNGHLLAAADRR
jgi:phosphoglycerate dehydrogenase-like enzyme